MDLSRLMSRLAAIGGMQGAVTEAEEKCTDCGKVHEGDCAVEEAKKPDADKDGIPDWADKDKEEKVDEGAMDKLKAFGKKALDTLGHGDDEDLIKDMQKKAGIPQTGKKPEEKVDEAKKPDADKDGIPDWADKDEKEKVEENDALSAMRKLAGITECGDDMGGEMSPMSVTGTEEPGMGVPAQVMSMDTGATSDASPKAKYTLSIQNGENNLQMTTDMPDEIIHIMKLAGVNKGAEVTKTEAPEAPEQEQTKAPKQEVEEEWGNTPAQTKERDPKAYGDIRDWGMKGTGAGKPGSAMNKPSGSGDNPLGEQAMMEAYKKFKASK